MGDKIAYILSLLRTFKIIQVMHGVIYSLKLFSNVGKLWLLVCFPHCVVGVVEEFEEVGKISGLESN